MDAVKVGILEPDNFSLKAIEQLNQIATIEKYNYKDIEAFISDKDILFVRLKYQIDDELLRSAKKLKFICSPTTGLNHISANKNIQVLSLKGETEFLSCIRATPEHIFGLTLSLLRNYKHAFLNKNNRLWNRDQFKGYEIYNNSIGIIGMGRIGRILAKYFYAFDAQVCYYDSDKQLNYQGPAKAMESVITLIEKSRIIILCADYREENQAFFDNRYFNIMQDRYFINASRGELLNENDFIKFIKYGKYLGIGIDVLSCETEGPPALNILIEAAEGKNVIITPHIGGATYTSMERTEEFITNKLIEALKLEKEMINS